MLRAFSLAIGQLGEPRFLRLVLLGIGAALVLLLALAAAISWLLAYAIPPGWGWAQAPAAAFGGIAGLVIAWFLFPVASAMAAGALAAPLAAEVERRHYPTAPPPRDSGAIEGLGQTLRLVGLGLLLNLLALPVYLLVPGINLILFMALNGYLIGREYYETAALRRFAPEEARRLRRRGRVGLWIAGAGLALVMTIPGLNLLAPFVAVTAMVHLVERERSRIRGE
jgi:CysZ protein